MIYLEQGREPVSWLSLLRKSEGIHGDTSRGPVCGWVGPSLHFWLRKKKNRNLAIPNSSAREAW